ncbi:MAG: NAD(P)-binding domain-containing protein [Rhizobiaceae bacterium]|nr:NAD(P)-binding domain-containing protein [Rhizobiaceae bacterium]
MTALGVVGGAGWLAGALLRPALAKGAIRPEDLILSSRRPTIAGFESWPAVRATTDNKTLAAQSDVVILSVRPEDLAGVEADLSGKLVISVMARVTMADITGRFGCDRLVRAMPNASAEQALSFTPWFASPAVTPLDRAFVSSFFSASGLARAVPNEPDIDYFTGLTGSGFAFPALMARAMIEHAVENGIAPDLADAAVRQLMLGAGAYVSEAKENAAGIVKSFVDYGGTTAAGLTAMIDRGSDAIVKAGLDAAWKKARQG